MQQAEPQRYTSHRQRLGDSQWDDCNCDHVTEREEARREKEDRWERVLLSQKWKKAEELQSGGCEAATSVIEKQREAETLDVAQHLGVTVQCMQSWHFPILSVSYYIWVSLLNWQPSWRTLRPVTEFKSRVCLQSAMMMTMLARVHFQMSVSHYSLADVKHSRLQLHQVDVITLARDAYASTQRTCKSHGEWSSCPVPQLTPVSARICVYMSSQSQGGWFDGA